MEIAKIVRKTISDEIIWKSLHHLILFFDFNEQEMLNLIDNIPHATYRNGLRTYKVYLNKNQKEAISALLGIYKALCILFTDKTQAMSWINRPNTLEPFNGFTPKAYMLTGNLERLIEVQWFLDFWSWH